MNQQQEYGVSALPSSSSVMATTSTTSSSSITLNGHQRFHLSNDAFPQQQMLVLNNNGGDRHHQQQLSTSTTMIQCCNNDSSPQSSSSSIQPKQQYQSSSVSTCQSNTNNTCLNVHNVPSTYSSPPIISTQQHSVAITVPSPSSHAFGTNNLSPFSFNGSSGSRDRAISSPPPLAYMKKHMISNNTPSPSNINNASPNSNHSSGGSGLTSPNCSDQMNLDDDCVMEQGYHEERPRRFSLPSNDLINMPFFRQKPQNLTSFQLFNPDTPINEPEIELKDITGMTVLSHSDCKEQYEMLVEELKEFNLYFSYGDNNI